MQNDKDEIRLVARRWNYMAASLITGLIAVVLAIITFSTSSMERDLQFTSITALTFTVMLSASVYSLLRVVFPTRIGLTPSGIELIVLTRPSFIPWPNYKGLRGGPNLIIATQDSNGSLRHIAIGMWAENLELIIHDFAQRHFVDVPIRRTARNQVSIGPLILLGIGLAIFGAIVVAYSLARHP